MDSPFWRQLIDHVASPIFVKDRAFRFVFVNRAFCELLGRSREEIIGRTDHDFFPREQADFFRQKDAEMFERDASIRIEEEPLTDGRGERHILSTTKAPLHDESGAITHLVGIIHDITHIKQVEAELRRANDELSAAQAQLSDEAADLELRLSDKTAELRRRHDELAAMVRELREAEALKDEFLQVASHELRTPLASLKLLLGAVRAQLTGERGAALQPLLERGHHVVERMRRLIGDILDASRLQRRSLPMELREVELGALLRDSAERLRSVSCPDHRLQVEVCAEPLRVRADPDRIEQILSNLLTNACKYAPEGTTVALRCEPRGGEAIVSIHDEGPGVPPELRDRVFERFYQVEAREGRAFGGLGLGLYISRQLVCAHGGRIWVESEPGQGSTFFFCLPLLDGP